MSPQPAGPPPCFPGSDCRWGVGSTGCGWPHPLDSRASWTLDGARPCMGTSPSVGPCVTDSEGRPPAHQPSLLRPHPACHPHPHCVASMPFSPDRPLHLLPSTELPCSHDRSNLKNMVAHPDGRGGSSRYIMGSGNVSAVCSPAAGKGEVPAASPGKGTTSLHDPDAAGAVHGPRLRSHPTSWGSRWPL